MDYGDYYVQYVPFIQELRRMLLSGRLGWSWNSFIGDGFASAYSYYTVFNPFAWFVACFPDDAILYGTLIATLMKLSVSMVCAMLFFRRFCSRDVFALVGALLYTFSGFTNVNTYFYFFLDVIAVFPLMMYGFELLISEGKYRVYVAAVVLNAAINFYFYVSTVLLVIVYTFFRLELYRRSSWKENWKRLRAIVAYSVIGTGLASFSLIPSIGAILNSGKAIESISGKIQMSIIPQIQFDRLYALLCPQDSGMCDTFFEADPWASTGAYLPVFGVFCVVQYCLQKRDWLGRLALALFVLYMVPVCNSAFSLFTNYGYTRWLYGLVLVFSLVTVRFLEEYTKKEVHINRRVASGIVLFTALFLLFPTGIYVLEYFGIPAANGLASICRSPYFLGYGALVVMLILISVNYLLMWLVTMRWKCSARSVFCCVAFMSLINMMVFNELNYDMHQFDCPYSNQEYYEKSVVDGVEKEDMSFTYRIDHPAQIRNYGLFKNLASVNYFNSLQNPGSLRFAVSCGIARDAKDTSMVTPESYAEYTDALLSVKYYYDFDRNAPVPLGFEFVSTENKMDIYQNSNYLPMGFTYDTYCLEQDLEDFSPEQVAKVMLSSLVVDSEDADIAAQYMEYEPGTRTDLVLSHLVEERRKEVCSYFEGSSSGFQAEIELADEEIVFFSIPNDPGWEITVNGKEARILTVHYGLMAICCQAGTNLISAEYHSSWCTSGAVLTLCVLVIFIAAEFLEAKRRGQAKICAS